VLFTTLKSAVASPCKVLLCSTIKCCYAALVGALQSAVVNAK